MANAPYTANLTPRQPDRSLEEALSEIERELRVRERCYGRWVEDGKMTRIDARDRFARLESAWLHLDKVLTLISGEPDENPDREESGSQEEP